MAISGTYYTTTDKVPGAPTGTYMYQLANFAKTNTSPIFTGKPNADKKVLPSEVNLNNYQDYLTLQDPNHSVVTNDITFKDNNITGTLLISGTYYTTSYHAAGAPTSNYNYTINGFASSSVKPVFTTKKNVSTILPSIVDSTNWTNYLNVTDSSALITNDINFNPGDSSGQLTVSGRYYSTSNKSPGYPTAPYSYTLSGFAEVYVAPTFSIIASQSQKVLPSTVNVSNCNNYLNIIDPSKDLIMSDMHFNSDDIKGQLTITGTYYTTSSKATGAPIDSFKYSLNGFASNSVKPMFVIIESNAKKVLPSAVNSSNYTSYLNVIDPSESLVQKDMKFIYDNSTGSLTIRGSYYLTSGDTSKSVYTYNFTNFAFPVKSGMDPKDLALIIGLISSALFIISCAGAFYYLNKTREERAIRAQIKRRKKRIQLQKTKNNFPTVKEKKMPNQVHQNRKYDYDKAVSLSKISRLSAESDLDGLIKGFQKTSTSVKYGKPHHNKATSVNLEKPVKASKWSSSYTGDIKDKSKVQPKFNTKANKYKSGVNVKNNKYNSKVSTKTKSKSGVNVKNNKYNSKINTKPNLKAKPQTYKEFQKQQQKIKKQKMKASKKS